MSRKPSSLPGFSKLQPADQILPSAWFCKRWNVMGIQHAHSFTGCLWLLLCRSGTVKEFQSASLGHQQRCHLGAGWKCRLSGHTPDLWNHNLHFLRSPGQCLCALKFETSMQFRISLSPALDFHQFLSRIQLEDQENRECWSPRL